MNYRKGNSNDVNQLKKLGLASWKQFKENLTNQNWDKLYKIVNNKDTYSELLRNSEYFVCENNNQVIVGMAFLVAQGNPTEIYDTKWCYIRFVSVDPAYSGNGIGKKLTNLCIETAINNNEQIIALHTSEIMKSARHIYGKLGFEIRREIEPRLGVKYWLYTLNLKSKKNNNTQ